MHKCSDIMYLKETQTSLVANNPNLLFLWFLLQKILLKNKLSKFKKLVLRNDDVINDRKNQGISTLENK